MKLGWLAVAQTADILAKPIISFSITAAAVLLNASRQFDRIDFE